MMTLNFADTHYMVKTINGEVQLQALVDGKKVIVTEASVRSDLQLDDEEGTKCLPNATIFEELTRMGAKTTAWNEFCSTMASVVICLATNQKFNFSKYIFKSMVKNSDNEGKFLMYPRFVQIFLDKQVDGMESHKRIYIAPSHTKKIFTIMRRSGKDFSGRVTPLFLIMVVQYQAEMGEDEVVNKEMDDSLERATTTATGLDAEQDSGPKRQDTIGDTIAHTRSENVSKLSNDLLLSRGNTLRSGEDSMQLQELMELYTNLQNRVIDLENIKTAQAQEITSLKKSVKKLEKKGGLRTHKLKRLYKVGRSARIVSSNEAGLGDQEDASKQGRKINDIDKDAEITLVDENQGSKKDDVVSATEETVSAATITNVELTLAQTLAELKSAKSIAAASTRSRAKGIVMIVREKAEKEAEAKIALKET
ncbi:hypothetical protein Tco_1363678 [Tanacetum coccineum]